MFGDGRVGGGLGSKQIWALGFGLIGRFVLVGGIFSLIVWNDVTGRKSST
jgi:hypothetical protein